jgi:hypothetical protein
MKQLYAPNGLKVIGTADVLPAIALIDGFEDDGSPIYAGTTKVDWDNQRPIQAEDVQGGDTIMVADEGGNHWKQSECKVVDEEEEDGNE